MKLLTKLTLSILAALPVQAIAIPATSRLLDLQGEAQTSLLREALEGGKDSRATKHIQTLFDNGLIETNEKMMMAKTPSHFGGD